MSADRGIANLFAVEQAQNIWRGGDPPLSGWLYLRDLGIERVVKLNTSAEGSDHYAERMGMKVYRFPMPWWRQVLLRPRQKDLIAAVSVMSANTFVHCEHGEDRTGLVVGCFRLSQGWTKDDAYSEMIAHGFHPELQGLQGRWNGERVEDWIRA